MKRAKRVISALLAGMMVFSMAGCGKNTFQGGEDTNFPYTWKEERKGTILLTLDGSYGSQDYHWSAVSSDDKVLQVTVAKKEKNGKVSYRLTPLAEGPAQVTFVREREVQDTIQGSIQGTDEEKGSTPAETQGEQAKGEENVKQNDAAADQPPQEEPSNDASSNNASPGENSADADYAAYAVKALEAYQEKYRPKDTICEIEVQINSAATGKKGKLKATVVVARTMEHKGIMQSSAGTQNVENGFDYMLWEDSNGMVQLRLPSLENSWSIDWLSNYIAPEDPGIPGIIIPTPEKENGKDVILEIQNMGIIDGAQSYLIQGLYQGTATIEFSNPEKEMHLMIDISITKDGIISVLSHSLTVPQG